MASRRIAPGWIDPCKVSWSMYLWETSTRSLFGLLTLVALAAPAQATPRPGESLPAFDVRDLLGHTHYSQELSGHPTIIVAITDPDAADTMRPWLDTAERRFGGTSVRIISLLALDLPFYATWSLAAGRARDRVPGAYWADTWLDRSGRVQQTLGFDEQRPLPYVLVLDSSGEVRATVHGEMDPHSAQQVWATVHPTIAVRQPIPPAVP